MARPARAPTSRDIARNIVSIAPIPTHRIALLAVDSSSRPDALMQAEIAANERSAALVASGATVVSIRTQVVYGSPWHVIVTIEYEAQGG